MGMKKTLGAALAAVILAGCSVMQAEQSTPLPKDAQWALLPVVNYSQTPQAGEGAESIVATLARARGLKLAHYPVKNEQGDALPVLDDSVRYRNALRWAASQGYRYALTGSVQEWRYKSGLDGEPAVGMTLQVVELPSEEVVWSATGARSGWGRESLSGTAQKVADSLLDRLDLN